MHPKFGAQNLLSFGLFYIAPCKVIRIYLLCLIFSYLLPYKVVALPTISMEEATAKSFSLLFTITFKSEKEQILLLSQNWKSDKKMVSKSKQIDSTPKIISNFGCTNNLFRGLKE